MTNAIDRLMNKIPAQRERELMSTDPTLLSPGDVDELVAIHRRDRMLYEAGGGKAKREVQMEDSSKIQAALQTFVKPSTPTNVPTFRRRI